MWGVVVTLLVCAVPFVVFGVFSIWWTRGVIPDTTRSEGEEERTWWTKDEETAYVVQLNTRLNSSRDSMKGEDDMPAKSKKQFNLMKAIEHGADVEGVSISPEKAGEYVAGQSPANLPARVPKKSGKGKGTKKRAKKAGRGKK